MHGGVQVVSTAAERHGAHVVLVSQIYITRRRRNRRWPGIVAARGRGEHALRASGAPYTIVRPSWLTDEPGATSGLRLEQGDTGDGEVSREGRR
jgi:uncharacterized protein YbjT (DUF2867 family)